jgi:putative MFS transporter
LSQYGPPLPQASGLLTVFVAIYVQVAILFGVYTPELFPTEVRLRANGICNTIGRAATIVSPFIVLALFLKLRGSRACWR